MYFLIQFCIRSRFYVLQFLKKESLFYTLYMQPTHCIMLYNKFTCKYDKIIHPILKGFLSFQWRKRRDQCWNFRTFYGGQEPSRNRVDEPARQATQAGGIDSLELIPGLLKSLKIPSQLTKTGSFDKGQQIRFDKF